MAAEDQRIQAKSISRHCQLKRAKRGQIRKLTLLVKQPHQQEEQIKLKLRVEEKATKK